MKATRPRTVLLVAQAIAVLALALPATSLAQRPGSVDTTFDAGEIIGDLPLTYEVSTVEDMALLPDGRLYIGGHINRIQGTSRDAIARLKPDGRLDPTFNEHAAAFGLDEDVHHLHLQPDFRLIARGWRYLFDGSGDPSFSGRPNVIAVQPDGKLLAVLPDQHTEPFRLNSDGTLDASFKATVMLWSAVPGVLVEPDGRIVMSAYFEADESHQLVRLLPTGALDPSFTRVEFDPYPGFGAEPPHRVVRQPDGRYLVAGIPYGINGGVVGDLVRLHADGTIDEEFPPAAFDPGREWDVYDIAIQPDGYILLAGSFSNPPPRLVMGVIRLHPDGTLDTSFDVGSGATVKEGERLPFVKRILLQPDGKLLVAGTFTKFDDIPRQHLVRLHAYHPLQITAEAQAGRMRLTVTGRSRPGYVEFSDDLKTWSILTRFCQEGRVAGVFYDPPPGEPIGVPRPARFYRAAFDAEWSVCL